MHIRNVGLKKWMCGEKTDSHKNLFDIYNINLVVALSLAGGGAADVRRDATVDDAGEVAGVAVDGGGAAGLVNAGVLVLVIVELGGLGLGAVGGRGAREDLGLDLLGAALLLGGDLGDGAVTELAEADLARTLGLDLVEEQVDVGGGEVLVNDLALLAHLGEVAVVHLGHLRGAAERGEGSEGGLDVRHNLLAVSGEM